MAKDIGGSKIRKECGCGNLVAYKGLTKDGEKRWKSRCTSCLRFGNKNKKPVCERCGFIAEDLCQIDIDHINCDPSDNRPENLMNLCSNCHRLKTKLNKDWNPKNDKM